MTLSLMRPYRAKQKSHSTLDAITQHGCWLKRIHPLESKFKLSSVMGAVSRNTKSLE